MDTHKMYSHSGDTHRAEVERVGQLWLDAPSKISPDVENGYLEFAHQVHRQFLNLPVPVFFQDTNPYSSPAEMFADIEWGQGLKVWRTQPDQEHPWLSSFENTCFRAVHDYYGHFKMDADFSIDGEFAAYQNHLKMFDGKPAREVLTAETMGQLGAFHLLGGKHPRQKAVRLEEIV